MSPETKDFLMFRRMITPALIQVIFWFFVVLVILIGIIGIVSSIISIGEVGAARGIGGVLGGILWIIIMPIIVRVYAELMILFFRMNETLTDIKNGLEAQNQKTAPPQPPAPRAAE